jgi:uncharacterized membrane protein YdjX (TVP38/TMEM64 family)
MKQQHLRAEYDRIFRRQSLTHHERICATPIPANSVALLFAQTCGRLDTTVWSVTGDCMFRKREALLQVSQPDHCRTVRQYLGSTLRPVTGFAVVDGKSPACSTLRKARFERSKAFCCQLVFAGVGSGVCCVARRSLSPWACARPVWCSTLPVRRGSAGGLLATARASPDYWSLRGLSKLARPECCSRAKKSCSMCRSKFALSSLRAKTEIDAENNASKTKRGALKRTLYLFGLAGSAIGAVSVIGHSLRTLSIDNLHDLVKWFESVGPTAVFYYAGLYYLLELVSFPALMLTIGAGYLFGVWRGLLVSSTAATAAAGTSFLLSRYFLRSLVQEKLASKFPRFRVIDRAVAKEGFKIVLLLRLSPLLPFSASNYLYGITSVRFVPYMVASWLGMLPGTLAYVYAGHTGNAVLESVASRVVEGNSDGLAAGASGVDTALLVVGLAATVAVLLLIGRTTSQALKEMDREMAVDMNSNPASNESDKVAGSHRTESVPLDTTISSSAERARRP